MALEIDAVLDLARGYLARQAWFVTATRNDAPGPIELVAADVLEPGRPGLLRLLLERGDRRFQLLVGWRGPQEIPGALKGEEGALFGAAQDGDEQVVVYDALADDSLSRLILRLATDGVEHAESVRLVTSRASHAALVYDERLFMKCYRVIEPGVRPEVEVLFGLDDAGFNALVAPVSRWTGHGYDLALVREFLPNALEGRPLALTSLRDLLGQAGWNEEPESAEPGEDRWDPDASAASAGGDFASEMARLGQTSARLHLALAQVFGKGQLTTAGLAGSVRACPQPEATEIAAAISALDQDELGRSIRLHGDYHLRRVLRSETGWLIAGFGDDPLYGEHSQDSSLRAVIGSPLEDIADMEFALDEVANEALSKHPQGEIDLAAQLAAAWRRRNKSAFQRGYLQCMEEAESDLLPPSLSVRELLLSGFALVRHSRYEATPAED